MQSNIYNAENIDKPRPVKINSLKSIMALRPRKTSEWNTFAFILNQDIIGPDGKADDLYAVIFPLGSSDNRTKEENYAKTVIETTGHPGVIVAKYGMPIRLSTKFDPSTIVDVPVDPKGKLIQLENAQYKRDKELYEQRLKIENDIKIECEEETNIDSIEHFKRQCYLAIKSRSTYQHHTKQAETAWQTYKQREMKVRDHFAKHPDHEVKWLPYLKEKLEERGESKLYNNIETVYNEIRDELLGLVESDDDIDDYNQSLTENISHSNTIPISTKEQNIHSEVAINENTSINQGMSVNQNITTIPNISLNQNITTVSNGPINQDILSNQNIITVSNGPVNQNISSVNRNTPITNNNISLVTNNALSIPKTTPIIPQQSVIPNQNNFNTSPMVGGQSVKFDTSMPVIKPVMPKKSETSQLFNLPVVPTVLSVTKHISMDNTNTSSLDTKHQILTNNDVEKLKQDKNKQCEFDVCVIENKQQNADNIISSVDIQN